MRRNSKKKFLKSVKPKKFEFSFDKTIISAGPTRTMRAGWTIEPMEDLTSATGIDAEDELAKILSEEINKDILANMKHELAKDVLRGIVGNEKN